MRFIYAVIIGIFVAVGVYAQADPVPTPAIDELYLARDNGSGKAGDQVNEFNTSDIPIHCVVLLGSTAKVTVKMNFVAVSVAGVKADTKIVTASYTTRDGQNRVNFTGRPEEKWTPGKYRVDVFLDGKIAKNVEFEIKTASVTATAAKFVTSTDPPKLIPPKRSRRP